MIFFTSDSLSSVPTQFDQSPLSLRRPPPPPRREMNCGDEIYGGTAVENKVPTTFYEELKPPARAATSLITPTFDLSPHRIGKEKRGNLGDPGWIQGCSLLLVPRNRLVFEHAMLFATEKIVVTGRRSASQVSLPSEKSQCT